MLTYIVQSEQNYKYQKGDYMSEEKKSLIRDVTARVDKLSEKDAHYIVGVMDGLILADEGRSDQKQKESS